MMGSPEDEEDRYNDEVQHEVELTRDFLMMKDLVTQALWESVMGENPSHFKGANRPINHSISLWIVRVYRYMVRVLGLLGRSEGEVGENSHYG